MLRGARTLFKLQKSLLIKDYDRNVISEKLQGKGNVFSLPLRFVTAAENKGREEETRSQTAKERKPVSYCHHVWKLLPIADISVR